MTKQKLIIFMASFFAGIAFNIAYAQIYPNFGPAFGGNGGSGSVRCDESGGVKDCYFYAILGDQANFQLYREGVTVAVDNSFANNANLRVETCLYQFLYSGNVTGCAMPIFGIAGSPTFFNGGNEIDLGYLADLNVVTVHIRVDHLYTNTTVGAYGRRVYINSLNLPGTAYLGQSFSVLWGVDNSPWNSEFFNFGPISCTTAYIDTGGGRADCVATGAGGASVEVRAYGPGGDGPQWVGQTKGINIPSPSGSISTNSGGSCNAPCSFTVNWSTSNVYLCNIKKNGAVISSATNNVACSSGGSFQANLDPGTYTYDLYESYTGAKLSSTTVTVNAGGPWVDIWADQAMVSYGAATIIRWRSQNVGWCNVSNGWTGTSGDYATGGLSASSTTYTINCGGGMGDASDSVTVNVPPPPSNPSGSCSVDGTSAQIAWTPASGYTHHYLRVQRTDGVWQIYNDDFTGSSYNWTATPGSIYNWWVHSRDTLSGAYSNSVGGTVDCRVLPKVNLTCDITP